MAQGLDAVKSALVRDFSMVEIHEDYDIDAQEFSLNFEADTLPYQVRVSREYDEDYSSGQINTDLAQLGAILRASSSGRVRVVRNGIISK